jgi:uncharacterized membrane protein
MQKMRYTTKELGIIKSLFADNEEALIALRKKMWDAKLSTTEKSLTTYNKESLDVLKKTFNPELDPDAPINQVVDRWTIAQFGEKKPEDARLVFKSVKIVIDYLAGMLDGKKVIQIDDLLYSENNDDETNLVNMMARNDIIRAIESSINQLYFLAGQKDETPEETIERLKKDSSK